MRENLNICLINDAIFYLCEVIHEGPKTMALSDYCYVCVGVGHELLNIIIRLALILLSTLDLVSLASFL